jgi:GTP-binding protein
MTTQPLLKERGMARADIRNIAIIAHVDHGKTTLVDGLLKQSNIFRANQAVGDLILDSNDLEREKGITILAKNTAVEYAGVKINVIDTPGHADFSGEVERVLNMADGCLLLVDAAEGPMPQTRYVLAKAFALGLRIILVINKVDRVFARPEAVLHATQDLVLELATDAEQLDFPVLYAIARDGRAGFVPDALAPDLTPLFQTILDHVPPPYGDPDGPFQMLVTTLDYEDYVGRIAIGRIRRGRVREGMSVARLTRSGEVVREKVAQVYTHLGLKRLPVPESAAGDLVALTGLAEAAIGDTLADPDAPEALDPFQIEEPTVRMTFGVSTSPLAGREGRFSTSRQLRARLYKELETNLSLRVADTESPDVFLVSGRGELHLAVLIETMRREGYEFQVSRPEAITKTIDGRLCEPVELLRIDTQPEYMGPISEELGSRLAQLTNLETEGDSALRLEYRVPTRGLIGFRNAFLTATRGNGVMATLYLGYEPWAGPLPTVRNGALVALEAGVAVSYGLANAQERGTLFIEPGTTVYAGMIVGVQAREQDLVVNVCKEKKQTNMRASTAEIAIRLTPPRRLSLEQALDFLNEDELLEVTPKSIRLRKRILDHEERARLRKDAKRS